MRGGLLFERFISSDRKEPPDIDVDFEHERREEVIQYIYKKYGRARAGIAGTVISYRGRSAIREVGKAFGLSEDSIGALTSSIWGGGGGSVSQDAVKRTGLDPQSPRMRLITRLAQEIQGFPRHLSQHVGGFVITRSRLDEVVPIGNGAMDERTFVEWDKDDLDALGILKVDVLGLGMLTCIRKALDLVATALSGCADAARLIFPLPLLFSPPPLAEVGERKRAGRGLFCERRASYAPSPTLPRKRGREQAAGGDRKQKPRPRHHPARRPRRLPHAVARGFARRLPGGKPRADVDAAAPAAGDVLRPGDRGGDRAPRPDPGRHGASLSAPQAEAGAGLLSLERTGSGAVQDAGRAAVPGAGDEDRHRRRRLHALGGRQVAPRHGDLQAHRHHRHASATR